LPLSSLVFILYFELTLPWIFISRLGDDFASNRLVIWHLWAAAHIKKRIVLLYARFLK
jgi:hypothetical protein